MGTEWVASHDIKNQLRNALKLESSKAPRDKDKKDRATVQQVFDKKTLKNLNKLYLNHFIEKLESSLISTGKEANVYYAVSCGEEKRELAVKIYKTMVLQFKDREEYIQGEF